MNILSKAEQKAQFEELKASIVGVNSIYTETNISDYQTYLEKKLRDIRRLNNAIIADDNTLLHTCLPDVIKNKLLSANKLFCKHGLNNFHHVTLKQLSTIPLIELLGVFGILHHEIVKLKRLLKKADLTFKQ